MSEMGTKTTLRERAQKWLDDYKAQRSNYLSSEDVAAIVAEYLNRSKSAETENEKTGLEAELERANSLNEELEERVKRLEDRVTHTMSLWTEAIGKIAAYEFTIKCLCGIENKAIK